MDSVEERDEEGYNLDDIQAKIERLERVLVQNAAGAMAPESRKYAPTSNQQGYGQSGSGLREHENHTASLNRESYGLTNSQKQAAQAGNGLVGKGELNPKQKASKKRGLNGKSSVTNAEDELQKDSARGHKQLSPKYVEPVHIAAKEASEDDQADEMGTLPKEIEHDLNQGAEGRPDPAPREGRDWDTERKKLQEEEKLLKVRRKIAAIKTELKETQVKRLREGKHPKFDCVIVREENQDQEGIWQTQLQKAKDSKLRRSRESKHPVEVERTYKLLSRGIASHFYKNLNKSQS